MELTAWVERTRSDRGVAGGDDSCTRMGQERFQFHPILPIQGFLNLRFVQSQNIPEPGDDWSSVKDVMCRKRLTLTFDLTRCLCARSCC